MGKLTPSTLSNVTRCVYVPTAWCHPCCHTLTVYVLMVYICEKENREVQPY